MTRTALGEELRGHELVELGLQPNYAAVMLGDYTQRTAVGKSMYRAHTSCPVRRLSRLEKWFCGRELGEAEVVPLNGCTRKASVRVPDRGGGVGDEGQIVGACQERHCRACGQENCRNPAPAPWRLAVAGAHCEAQFESEWAAAFGEIGAELTPFV